MPSLEPGEDIILGENTKYFGKLFGQEGYLTLTNRRLIFEHGSGLISKRTYTNVEIPLEAVQNVTVEGVLKKLIVVVKPGYVSEIVRRLEFGVRDPYSWQNRLLLLRKATAITSTPMGWQCPKCANFNPHDIPVCRRCGTTKQAIYQMSPPPSSEKSFCAFCGAELRQDAIFCSKCGKKLD